MLKEKIVQNIIDDGAIAVLRLKDESKSLKVIEALINGGIRFIEITMTVPNSFSVLQNAIKIFSHDITAGMGTVLNRQDAIKAIDYGAQYIVSPVFKDEVLAAGHESDIPVFPGCFTPTEIQNAYEKGADIIKVFPADVLGMSFFKGVKAPLPHLKIMPTGGVTPENAGEWLKAGACAVGIGASLIDQKAIANEDYKLLTDKARILKQSIEAAHKQLYSHT